MKKHIANGNAIPCLGGKCRICQLIDPDGPHYREDYRRMFHPEEFGGEVAAEKPRPSGMNPPPRATGGCGCGGKK